MRRYRKILVAVDASESSKNALRQACKVARKNNGWVTVITVVPPYEDQFEIKSVKNGVKKTLREVGEKTLDEVRRIAAEEDSFIKTGLLEGAPAESIAAVAEEGVFDLIVMGKSSMSRIDRALTGSVTSGVIARVGCDVLVCRKDTAIGWDMVLLPTDGSRCCRTATASAIEMARLNGSGFAAVSVADVSDNYRAQVPEVLDNIFRELKAVLDEVRSLAEASGVKAKTFVTEGEAYKAITELAKGLGAGVIVMGSHGRSGIKKLLTVSVADQVISHASCPVLVVKT